MSCFILCQECGEIYDTTSIDVHTCNTGMTSSGFCNNCGQHGTTDMVYDVTGGTYSHRDLRECIKNLRDEIGHEEGHNLSNDTRLFDLEKKLSEFVEGRRAAVEATKEKMIHQTIREDNSGRLSYQGETNEQ